MARLRVRLSMKKLSQSNPFLEQEFSIPIKRLTTYNSFKGNFKNGRSNNEISSQQRESKVVDVGKNTKVFKSKELFNQFLQLSAQAKNLFMYVLLKQPYNRDYFEFRDADFAKLTGKSERTVREWRAECKWLMIPKSGRKNMYWINPAIMFNGNRINYFPEYFNNFIDSNDIAEENEYVSIPDQENKPQVSVMEDIR